MDILTGKIVTALLFLFGSLIASITPVALSRQSHGQRHETDRVSTVLGLCNSLAGGIFLATCFVALFPVVHSSYESYFNSLPNTSVNHDRPYSEMTILAGFFIVLFVEQLANILQASRVKSRDLNDNHHTLEEESLISSDTENHPSVPQIHKGHGHLHSHVSEDSLMHSIFMMLALGTHTLFEGMAIGLLNNIDVFVSLVIAVAIHEFCCAIALGITIGQKKLKTLAAYGLCITFSLMMPGGIFIGLSLDSITGTAGLLTCAIIQGLATGTFFYVLFMEIIPASLSSPKPLLHVFVMFLGCALMSLIIIYTHKHHNMGARGPIAENTTHLMYPGGS